MPERNNGAHAILMLTYWVLFPSVVTFARLFRRPLPSRLSFIDIWALGIATFRLARIISYDRVTSFLRQPFVESGKGPMQPEGTQEVPKGHGLQLAIGELLTSSWSTGVWIASFLGYGLVLAPRVTRLFIRSYAAAGIGQMVDEVYRTLTSKHGEGSAGESSGKQ